MKRMFESDNINSQFLHTAWLEEYEKPMLGAVL